MLQTTFGSEACEQCWDVTNYIRAEACAQCWDVTNYIRIRNMQCWDVTNNIQIRSMWAMLRCYKLHLYQKHVSNVEMLQTTSGSEACAQCWDVTNYIWIRRMWAMLRCYELHPGRSMCAMLRCYKLHSDQKHVSNVEMLQTTSGSEACEQCWDVTNYI